MVLSLSCIISVSALFGKIFIGPILKGVGALITAIGLGQIIAGYLYPNTSEEITNAVEDFEKN